MRAVNNGMDAVDENKMNVEEIGNEIQILQLVDGDNAEKYVYPLQKLMNYVYTSAEFEKGVLEKWTVWLHDFHAKMNHRWDKHKTNEKHKQELENVLGSTIVFVADFKQKMIIGRSQIEVSEEYRECQCPRSVLGLHVATQTSRKWIDYISDCTSHRSAVGVQNIRHLFDEDRLN